MDNERSFYEEQLGINISAASVSDLRRMYYLMMDEKQPVVKPDNPPTAPTALNLSLGLVLNNNLLDTILNLRSRLDVAESALKDAGLLQ